VAVGVYPDGVIKHKCLSRGYTAWWQRKSYFTFMASYILVVPAVVICFCYFNVVRVVWRQGKEVSMKKGIELRKTVKNERFLVRTKIKTIKVSIEQVRMYYRSRTGGRCCIGAHQTHRVHSPGGGTFLHEMTSWPPVRKCDVKSKIRLRQSMRIYSKNSAAEFHPDPI